MFALRLGFALERNKSRNKRISILKSGASLECEHNPQRYKRMNSRLSHHLGFWHLPALIVAILGSPSPSQAQSAWPASFDIAGGPSRGWGGNYVERSGASLAFMITHRHDHAGTVAFAVGYARFGGNGDSCGLVPGQPAQCLGDFPSTYHASMLFGASHRFGAASLRALAGPALFVGDGSPGIGPQTQIDAAFGVQHVEFAVGYRASLIRRAAGETQGLGDGLLGLRFR